MSQKRVNYYFALCLSKNMNRFQWKLVGLIYTVSGKKVPLLQLSRFLVDFQFFTNGNRNGYSTIPYNLFT